jgi:hydroxyacylglutathione hydrolase
MTISVHTIRLKLSNVTLVLGDRPILIDSGSPGEAPRIQKALAEHGVAVSDLAAIVHTHGHADHVGSTHALTVAANKGRETPLPVLLHGGDVATAAQGHNNTLHPTSPFAYVIRLFTNPPFEPFAPTIAVNDRIRLDNYGVPGTILPLPGHTEGSVVVVLDSGEAVVGDLFRGGFMGGALAPRIPKPHYFADNRNQVAQSIRSLLDHDISTFHVGHGGPIPGVKVRTKWKPSQPAARPQTDRKQSS